MLENGSLKKSSNISISYIGRVIQRLPACVSMFPVLFFTTCSRPASGQGYMTYTAVCVCLCVWAHICFLLSAFWF